MVTSESFQICFQCGPEIIKLFLQEGLVISLSLLKLFCPCLFSERGLLAIWNYTPVPGPVSWCLGDGTEQLGCFPKNFASDAVRELLSSG